MLWERSWEDEKDFDPFDHDADYLFCDGKLEMQDIGEYWMFRTRLKEKGKC